MHGARGSAVTQSRCEKRQQRALLPSWKWAGHWRCQVTDQQSEMLLPALSYWWWRWRVMNRSVGGQVALGCCLQKVVVAWKQGTTAWVMGVVSCKLTWTNELVSQFLSCSDNKFFFIYEHRLQLLKMLWDLLLTEHRCNKKWAHFTALRNLPIK